MACHRSLIVALTLLVVASVAATAGAVTIIGQGNVGSFAGSINYVGLSPTQGQLSISLQNTSPLANGGYITALAFNNPSDRFETAVLTPTDPDFEILGVDGGNQIIGDSVSGSPYNDFDLGAATGHSFLGGGSPSAGIAVGDLAGFNFLLTGDALDTLTTTDILNEFSSSTAHGASFLVRFRGFNNDASDKVTITTTGGIDPGPVSSPGAIPEPTTALAFVIAILGYTAVTARRRRQARASSEGGQAAD